MQVNAHLAASPTPDKSVWASSQGFGSKKIGFFASVALLINNITGPGVPQLPNLFVESGWLTPVLCILGVWIMTTLSSAMFWLI